MRTISLYCCKNVSLFTLNEKPAVGNQIVKVHGFVKQIKITNVYIKIKIICYLNY